MLFLKPRVVKKRENFRNGGELIEEDREQVLNFTHILSRTESIKKKIYT